MPGLADWFGQPVPQQVGQDANRAGWAAFLSSAANARPGYLGQALLGGLGPQEEARQSVLARYFEEQQARQQQAQSIQYQQAIMQQMQARQQQEAAEQQFRQQQAQQQEAQRQQLRQAAESLLSQLPDGSPERQVGATMATAGDLKGLQALVQKVRQQQEQAAAYAQYGVDPNDPVAKERIKQQLGMGQQQRPPQLQYTRRGAFNPRTGELTPFPGEQGMDPALERAQREATDMVARESVAAQRVGETMTPQQMAQRVQQLTAALYQGYASQPAGLPGVDPAMAGAAPQGIVRVTPGQAPTVTPRGALPDVSRGTTSPIDQEQTYSVMGQKITHSQAVKMARRDLLIYGEKKLRPRLRKLGFDETTIGQLIADARNR